LDNGCCSTDHSGHETVPPHKTQLPPELLATLRLDTLEHTRESFLSARENEKRIDLLYSANFVDGSEVLICILLEHKSDINRRIALLLLAYVLEIYEWRRRNHQPLRDVFLSHVRTGSPNSLMTACPSRGTTV
jgi:hypothetical protein